MPWLDRSPVRSARFRPLYKILFWIFMSACLTLGWVGSQKPEGLPLLLGRVATAYYFIHFLLFVPLLNRIERPLPLPDSLQKKPLSVQSSGGSS